MSFLDSADDDPKRRQRRPLLAFILGTLAVGVGASVFAKQAIPTWYARLVQPSIAPPNWIFPPVWTALYVVMAVAAWRTWRVTGTRSREMAAYGVQLALNFAWCVIFFAAHRIGPALAEIIVLDLAILVTMILFFAKDRIAGLLFLPYLGWNLFATALTYSFWALNP